MLPGGQICGEKRKDLSLRARRHFGTEPLDDRQRWKDDKSTAQFIHSGLGKNNILPSLQSS
jgi:hypothetical protein